MISIPWKFTKYAHQKRCCPCFRNGRRGAVNHLSLNYLLTSLLNLVIEQYSDLKTKAYSFDKSKLWPILGNKISSQNIENYGNGNYFIHVEDEARSCQAIDSLIAIVKSNKIFYISSEYFVYQTLHIFQCKLRYWCEPFSYILFSTTQKAVHF